MKFLVEVDIAGPDPAAGAKEMVDRSNYIVEKAGSIRLSAGNAAVGYRLVPNLSTIADTATQLTSVKPEGSAYYAAVGVAVLSGAGFLIGLLF
jgi:hypothetical protein